MQKPHKRLPINLTVASILIASLAGLVLSACYLLAEYRFYTSSNILATTDSAPKPAPFASVFELRPNHIRAVDAKAQWLYQRWRNEPLDESVQVDLLKAYERALDIRPHWPLTQAKQLRVLASESSLTPEFYDLFDQLYANARYERYASNIVLQIGINNWYRLPETYRTQVIDLMDVALLSKANSTLTLKNWLDQQNLLSWFCKEITPTARAIDMCTR